MFTRGKSAYFLLLVVLCTLLTAKVFGAEPYEEGAKKHSWFSFNKPAKTTPAAQMEYAQSLLKQKKLNKAAKAFRALSMTWPGSAEAPMAIWAYAKILDNRGDTLDAFDEYQKLMENYSGRFPDYEKALSRQFEIATNLMYTKKAQFLFLPGFDAPERAIPYLEKVVRNGPRSPHAPEAQYLIGVANELNFEYELAVVSYIATLHRYPLSPFAEKAAFGRARALHEITVNYPNDAEALDEAWAGVMVFLRAYPNSVHAAEVTAMRDNLLQRKADQSFAIANFYDRKAKKPAAAVESYERFLEQFPRSDNTEVARERISVLADKVDKKKDASDEEN